jgi:sulfur carrier protein ThiS
MKIELKLFASLAAYRPGGTDDVPAGTASVPAGTVRNETGMIDVAEGTTVGAFLKQLEIPENLVKIVFLNGVHAREDDVLKEGDRLGVFPPVAGG